MELSVHLGVLGELGLRESWSAGGSSLRHVGVDRMSVSRCRRNSVVREGVEINDGVQGDHVEELRCNIFWGSSLEVLGFLVEPEIMCLVVGWYCLESGW